MNVLLEIFKKHKLSQLWTTTVIYDNNYDAQYTAQIRNLANVMCVCLFACTVHYLREEL